MNFLQSRVILAALGVMFAGSTVSLIAIETKAPTVTHIEWGKIKVRHADGSLYEYKDCKIFPAGSSVWDWRETGTEHTPGTQVSDLLEFIDQVDVVILSAGVHGMLKVHPETIKYLKELGKEFYYLETAEAVKRYHELIQQGQKVGVVLHSTC